MQKISTEIASTYDVGIIGLGYVGLTLAVILANRGLNILGIEKNKQIAFSISKGKPHFYEENLTEVLNNVLQKNNLVVKNTLNNNIHCNVYIITVGTPLDIKGKARMDYITTATMQVADNMPNDALVILRSTVKVGTTRNIVKPLLEKSGKKFQLSFCPERTLEGSAIQELIKLPQIIGAEDVNTFNKTANLFLQITKNIIHMKSLEAAEIVKLVDNSYRDVIFGFANEISRICSAFNINANDIIKKSQYKYPRNNIPLPGLVGGPCLEKDPHIFAESATEKGINLDIIKAARLVNERQPEETVKFIIKQLKNQLKPKITIWGIAFKGYPETNDVRGSMAIKIIEELILKIPNSKIFIYDAVCSYKDLKKINHKINVIKDKYKSITKSDCLIITNNHIKFSKTKLDSILELLNKNGFIYDYWNHFEHQILNKKSQDKYFSLNI